MRLGIQPPLPTEAKLNMMYQHEKFDTYEKLKEYIREREEFARVHGLSGKGVYSVDKEDQGEYTSRLSSQQDEEEEPEYMSREELIAFVRRNGTGRAPRGDRKAASGGGSGGRRPDTPPRGQKDLRCGNCGEKGHVSAECSKPRLSASQRKCFSCGEAGHISSKCTKGGTGKAIAAVDAKPGVAPRDNGHVQFCIVGEEHLPTARGQPFKPERRPITLADFMTPPQKSPFEHTNRWDILQESSQDECTSRDLKGDTWRPKPNRFQRTKQQRDRKIKLAYKHDEPNGETLLDMESDRLMDFLAAMGISEEIDSMTRGGKLEYVSDTEAVE